MGRANGLPVWTVLAAVGLCLHEIACERGHQFNFWVVASPSCLLPLLTTPILLEWEPRRVE